MLRTWIHDNNCDLTIKSNPGQHTEFLRFFLKWERPQLNLWAGSNFGDSILRLHEERWPSWPGWSEGSFSDQSLLERHSLNLLPLHWQSLLGPLVLADSGSCSQPSWTLATRLWMMKVFAVLLLASPLLPRAETRRPSYVPGAMSHLSRHFFSRIRARNQQQQEEEGVHPQITFGSRQNKKYVHHHQEHDHINKQGQEVHQKQIRWNQSKKRIEESQRDETKQLLSKIKNDLVQAIRNLVR